MRFVPEFDTAAEAASFALEQGIAWIGAAPSSACHTATPKEQSPWPRKN